MIKEFLFSSLGKKSRYVVDGDFFDFILLYPFGR